MSLLTMVAKALSPLLLFHQLISLFTLSTSFLCFITLAHSLFFIPLLSCGFFPTLFNFSLYTLNSSFIFHRLRICWTGPITIISIQIELLCQSTPVDHWEACRLDATSKAGGAAFVVLYGVLCVRNWINLSHKKEPVEDPVGMDCLVPNTVQYSLVLCDIY